MYRNLLITALIGLFSTGCDLLNQQAAGTWELEVEDAEMCELELELEQDGEDLEGEADLLCRLYFSYDGETFYYDLQTNGADVEGSYEDGEVELEASFYDEGFDAEIRLEIEGELEDGEFEGELMLDGDYFGDLSGEVEA